MALDSVSKIEVVFHEGSRRDVLFELERFGGFAPVDLSGSEDLLGPADVTLEDLEDDIDVLERTISFLEEEAGDSPGGLTYTPPTHSEDELLALAEDEELMDTARRAWRVARELAELDSDYREAMQELSFLEGWKGLSVPLEELGSETGSHLALAGTLPPDGLERLRDWMVTEPLVHLEEVARERGSLRVLLVCHGSVSGELGEQLTEAGFTRQDFGDRSGRPGELLGGVRQRLWDIERREEELRQEAQAEAEELGRLRALRDALGLLHTRLSAAASGRSSQRFGLLRGWVRSRELSELRKRLDPIGPVSVAEREPEEDETPPSPLSEPDPVDPYVSLTDMFGRPSRRDLDPTPFLAPFFAFFLGICIGDGGYGLALAAGAAAGWSIVRRRGGNPRLFGVLFQGGIASIVVGLFLGSWFGAPQESLPGFLQAPAELLNSIVPASQDVEFALSKQFLYVTLGLGLVQLTFGVLLDMAKRLRAGEGVSAVVDQTGWLLAIAGLFPWLFNRYLLDESLFPADSATSTFFLYLLAAGAVLIFIMGGREAKGLGGRIGLGAYAAYGIINLLGDVLSYSRLFALALSSAIIGRVVNQMGGMLAGIGIPVLGVVLAAVVIVAGHLFNLFMAVLSGYIHTARLQFVEFFSKFFDGTGAPFVPLRYRPRFVLIDNRGGQAQSTQGRE
jgi:V/A-type H+-transporting ATPase subunit I